MDVEVRSLIQQIAFPSVLDYVSFQLLATPMAALLKDRDQAGRERASEAVATETAALAGPGMIEGGRFAFPQEAYAAVAKA